MYCQLINRWLIILKKKHEIPCFCFVLKEIYSNNLILTRNLYFGILGDSVYFLKIISPKSLKLLPVVI